MLKKFFAVAIVGTISQLSTGLEIGTAPEKVATTQNLSLSQSEANSSYKHLSQKIEAAQIDRLTLDNNLAITPADSLMAA